MPAPKPLRTAGRRQASDRPSSHYDQLNEIQAFAWSIMDTEAGYAREINDRLGYRLKVYGCPMHSAFGAAMGAGRGRAVGSVSQIEQRTDVLLVAAPPCNGILVNLLPHLPRAGSHHLTFILMEIQAPLIPFEAEEIQNLARPRLLIGDQFRVRYVKNRIPEEEQSANAPSGAGAPGSSGPGRTNPR